ncbi:hypothetical protein DNTS_026268 [Danionella cerebrum]|uniref:Transmembrane protein 154 n=1 Tax=Danionella cerebrum TaxID=2873325 RepID=A0A553N5I7_9TELE|nr:hypothetical protein DNTS_026268 [Danionella translucida]
MNHRGLWEMNRTLLLILALTASWTTLAQTEDPEKTEDFFEELSSTSLTPKQEALPEDSDPIDVEATATSESVNTEETEVPGEPETAPDSEDMNTTLMIVIPLVLSLVICAVIMCVVIVCRRCSSENDSKEDTYLDDEDHEKVPMPMFEDDVPSVMELEMEDLENWMGKGHYLNNNSEALLSSFK